MEKNFDIESNKRLLLHQKSCDIDDPNAVSDVYEKVLESFRLHAHIINKNYPKNSPLSVIETELRELFNQFLYDWPDNIWWIKHDKRRQNLIENIYYSLGYADFKFTLDELEYLINVWSACKANAQNTSLHNVDMMDSLEAFKELKSMLVVKKVNYKSTRNRKIIEKRAKQLNNNGFAVESLLRALLHKHEFDILKVLFLIYEKQDIGVSVIADSVYKKVIERIAIELSTGSIESMENKCAFFHFLLDHEKIGKDYITNSQTFKELQRVGAKRTLEMILSKKPFLGALDPNGELMIAGLGKELLTRLLNNLIEPQANNKRILEMDVECLIPSQQYLAENPKYNEMTLFYYFSCNRELRSLLTHPIVETLIKLKYKKLRAYNWDLILWRVVVLLVVLLQYVFPTSNSYIVSWTIFVLLTLSEFYAYFKAPSQIRIFLFGFLNLATLGALFVFLYDNCVNESCPNITGFGSILLAINVTFIMCYFSDRVAIYVFMLFSVARSAFKFLVAISIMLLGFAYCLSQQLGQLEDFHLQEQEYFAQSENQTTNLIKIVFKTFVMLSGELEAGGIPYLHHTSYVVFFIFIFFVPIVSVNLLSGLAVGDVHEVISNARLWHLTTITMFLYSYEKGSIKRTSLRMYMESFKYHYIRLGDYLRSIFDKKIYKNDGPLTSSRLFKSFNQCTKLYVDCNSKGINLQDQNISQCSSHIIRKSIDTVNVGKMRKRKTREEKNHQRDKNIAKKSLQQMADKINRMEKKINRIQHLQEQFKVLSNHIIYLHQTSPSHSKQELGDRQRARRRSY